MEPALPSITRERFDAVLLDLDGVLTATAKIHAECWKQTFDAFLSEWARLGRQGRTEPFDLHQDYRRYVDGKPRYDGVRSFLAARGILLPEGGPADPPEALTICGLGKRKDAGVNDAIAAGRVAAFPGSVAFVRHIRTAGIKTAVVSSSRHCRQVLRAAQLLDQFDAVVDGKLIESERLIGKPAPDTFLHAARMLGVVPGRAIVVEDAVAGVQAGRAGGFALVIGVDRGDNREALGNGGADVVIEDLGALLR